MVNLIIRKATLLFLLFSVFSADLFPQADNDPTVCSISELGDVRQNIYPETFTFFTTPLLGYDMLKLYDIGDFVICCYDYRLDVYDKKNQFWQIFTPSDGYDPITATIKFSENYEDYFLISGNNKYYQKDVINVFDKRNFKIFSLDYEEYSRLKKNWKPVSYTNTDPDTSWYVEENYPYSIIREDMKTGQKSSFSFNDIYVNHFNRLISVGNNIIGGKENGIIIYDKEQESRYLNSSNILFSDHITDVTTYGDNLIILYDSIIDRVDLNTPDLLRRLNLHTTADHAFLEGNNLFYTQNDKLFHIDLSDDSEIFSTRFNYRIENLSYQTPFLFIETSIGISSYNINNQIIKNFINNNIVDEVDENYYGDSGEEEYPGFTVLGWLDNDIVATIKYWSNEKSLSQVDLIRFRCSEESIDTLVIPGEISKEILESRQCKIEDDHLLIANDTLIDVYSINPPENFVYSINSAYNFNFAKIYSGELKKNNLTRYIPNAFERQIHYPAGKEITNIAFNNDVLWITTDKGLFSYNTDTEKWTSHFMGTTFLLGDRLLLITKNDIYFGGGNAVADWPGSKIDRKNYMIQYFYSDAPKVWINSFKYTDNEIIACSPKGIYSYNDLHDTTSLILTPTPVGQASFYKDKYLASDGNSVYLIDNNGNIADTFKLERPLGKNSYRDAPELMEVDDQIIWFSSFFSFGNLILTRYSLKDGSQTDYFSRQPIIKILPDIDFTWILTEENIYRFDKESEELVDLGNIKNTSFRVPEKAKITDGILVDQILYLTCIDGIYRLNTETMDVGKIDMDFYVHFIPRSIKYYDSLFFIGTQIGIMQFKNDYFREQFKSDWFVQVSGDKERKLMLPFNAPDTIIIDDPQYRVSLTFDLEDELTDIYFDRILPNKNLLAFIDTLKIDIIRTVGTMPETKNIYSIILDPETLDNDNFDLQIFFKDAEANFTEIKKWTFNINRRGRL